MTIDLVRMDGIEMKESEGRKSVVLGAGLRWGRVYQELEKRGLMVIGGRVSDVGVGGLILGGGISFFSAEYGWACDNVVAYEIVLPDGEIKRVDRTSAPDLYWALRGAGAANFGVVTSFEVETFERVSPSVWEVTSYWSDERWSELTRLGHGWMFEDESETKGNTGGFISYVYSAEYKSFLAASTLVHTKHDTLSAWPEQFKGFEKLEPMEGTGVPVLRPVSNITGDVDKANPYGVRWIYATFSHWPSIEYHDQALQMFKETAGHLTEIEGLVLSYVTQPITRSMIKHMSRNGGNPLGLTEEDDSLMLFSLAWGWKNRENDDLIYREYGNFMARTRRLAQEMRVLHRFIYANYAEGEQDPWSGYGAENLARLRKIQRQVDPTGVFTQGGLGRGFFKINREVPAGVVGKDEL